MNVGDNGRERKMSGNDDKKGKVESLSFRLVMLRLDRGIRRIASDDRGITRSSRVMTKRGERRAMTIRKGKLIMTTKEKKPLKAVRETSRITEI